MLCYICQEEIIEILEKSEKFQLTCSHTFHIDCISRIRKAQCPACRYPTLNLPCIEEILKREQQDIKRIQVEQELSACLDQLEEIEKYIKYIEIPIKKN